MELARRFSIFYSASLLAGAFGGLLAGAILSGLNGAKGLPAWKWLFVSESLDRCPGQSIKPGRVDGVHMACESGENWATPQRDAVGAELMGQSRA